MTTQATVTPRFEDDVRNNGARIRGRSPALAARRAEFAAKARLTTIDDWSASATAPPTQLRAFDVAMEDLHDSVAVANHDIFGDPLPAHLPGGAVQLAERRRRSTPTPADAHAVAAGGVRGPGSEIPHHDRIQAAFGRHDVSSIRAHVGGDARAASEHLGAIAYASGESVAFVAAPDLHTAAHEAAHVVQQRAGVRLAGGVGRAGDEYERHADRVADQVVRGESVERLLGPIGGGGAMEPNVGAASAPVQRKAAASTTTTAPESAERQGEFAAVTDAHAVARHPPDFKPTQEVIPRGTGVEILERTSHRDTSYVHIRDVRGGSEWWTAERNVRMAARPGGMEGIDQAALASLSSAVIAASPADMQADAATTVPVILRQCAELRVQDAREVAYLLATARHESRLGKTMVEDRSRSQPQAGGWAATNHVTGNTTTGATKDELDDNYWREAYAGSGNKLGNTPGSADGKTYRGRGHVQLTGKNNYAKMSAVLNAQGFSYTHQGIRYGGAEPTAEEQETLGKSIAWEPQIDLVAHPEHVSEVPALSARILVEGGHSGHFKEGGGKVGDHVGGKGDKRDYRGARTLVNGDGGKPADGKGPYDESESDKTLAARIGRITELYAGILMADGGWARVFATAR